MIGPTTYSVYTDKEIIFPKYVLLCTFFICLLPLLYLFNVEFSFASQTRVFDIVELSSWGLKNEHVEDEMFYALNGGIQHALLEWTAVVFAFLGAFVAFFHYSVSKDLTAPVIGIALLLSGTMDFFHVLAATRLVDAIAENNNLMPFTWAVSRCFNAFVLLLGGLFLLISKHRSFDIKIKHVVIFGLPLLLTVYFLASWMTESQQLPQTQYPNDIISRPFDVLPMAIFICCIPVFLLLYIKSPSFVVVSILISLLPDFFSEAYMALGSTQLFDHYFNSSHFLKILGYLLPCYGFMLHYRQFFLQKSLKGEEQLVQVNKTLELTEARYRLINRLLPVGYMLVADDGKICEVNSYTCKLFGYEESELLSMTVEQLVPMESRVGHQHLRRGFSSEHGQRQMAANSKSLSGLHKDGSLIPLEIGLAPITFDLQSFTAVSLLNIKERREAMEELEGKNFQMDMALGKLQQSNEQLERFAFICSHDLQEPIRMVLSFSQLLEKKAADKLDDKSILYLKYITDGALRAKDMVADILSFCRLDLNTEAYTPVDLNILCGHVNRTLQVTLDENNAKFEWDSNLPFINGVLSQIFQLIMNLVSNGIKFNRSERPVVKLSCTELDDCWEIIVSDNGIGIEQQYIHKLFTIFTRLNSKSEFSGTGIGLAICKKIVEQHEAKIHIESVVDSGSKFILLWPKSES